MRFSSIGLGLLAAIPLVQCGPYFPPYDSPRPAETGASDSICETQWEFFYESFNVYGYNLDVGKAGERLKHEISGCGLISEWEFGQTVPQAGNAWNWYARGKLPIQLADCVGHAVVTAGGDTDGCISH